MRRKIKHCDNITRAIPPKVVERTIESNVIKQLDLVIIQPIFLKIIYNFETFINFRLSAIIIQTQHLDGKATKMP